MRLDRILYTGNTISCKEISIKFNEPVFVDKSEEKVNHHMYLKGGIMYLGDMLGLNLFKSAKEGYLYPSDHFGLLGCFSIIKK
jgi:hypothetical protein